MVMNIRVLTPDRVICSTTADEVVIGTDVFQIIRVTVVKQAGVDVSYKMYLRG